MDTSPPITVTTELNFGEAATAETKQLVSAVCAVRGIPQDHTVAEPEVVTAKKAPVDYPTNDQPQP